MPALGPINYSTGVDSPVAALNNGAVAADNLGVAQQQNMAVQQQQSLNADAAEVAKNPTPQAISGLVVKYPQLVSQTKSVFDAMNTAQQTARVQAAVPIYAAVASGNNDIAVKMLQDQATGYDNSGDKNGAAQSRMIASLVQSHPDQAKILLGTQLAGAMGPDRFAETFRTVGTETRANALQPAAVTTANAGATTAAANAGVAPTVAAATAKGAVAEADTKTAQVPFAGPQAAAGVANVEQATQASKDATALAKDTLLSNIQLKKQELAMQYGVVPEGSQKIVNESTEKSIAAAAQADRFASFANKYANVNLSNSPTLNNAQKVFNDTVGGAGTNGLKDLQNEYSRLRATGIVDSLPPQVQRLTDKDLALFGNGIPTATDSPERAVAFLKSIATVKQLEAVTEDAKAQWAASNHMGGLGPAKNDITINGVAVPQGMPFPAFLRQYQTAQMTNYVKQQAAKTVQGRGYMSYTTPAASSGQQ